jgi:hypothetical protein
MTALMMPYRSHHASTPGYRLLIDRTSGGAECGKTARSDL